jgi:hypothetical protein
MELSIMNSSLVKNENLEMKMIVKKDSLEVEVEWIVEKKSSIPNGGFGMFALRNFEADEEVSIYFGEKMKPEEKVSYAFWM